MSDVTATEAARNFSDLLDNVEHGGESYTIVRRGRAVAHLEPVDRGQGDAAKAVLRRHRPDEDWSGDLDDVRSMLEIDERP
ncbi:MAG: type II toxin-antitoxin system prevent-host-death family antitoxin [Acidimicrobiia bacterium]